MNDIEELQRRITAAMDRVAYGLEKMSAAPSGGDTDGATDLATDLASELEDEKLANAQLTERVRVLSERLEAQSASQEDAAAQKAASEASAQRMQELDEEVQRLRAASSELRKSNQQLREANAEGLADPDLINKSMQAELDALRAQRDVDVSETSAIIEALTPLVGGAAKEGDA